MNPSRVSALLIATSLLLTACGSPSTTAPPAAAQATTNPAAPVEQATIVESGFGQQNEYAWVTALVKNNTDKTGQSVTVNFNLKDASGAILKSQSQVEGFSWAGQELAVGTQVDLDSGRTKVASVEAAIQVEDYGRDAKPVAQFTLGAVKLTEDQYVKGQFEASFEVTNPGAEPLTEARIGVICYDSASKIVGGSSVYPELVPANGKIRATSTGLIVSKKPASCKAFPGHLGV